MHEWRFQSEIDQFNPRVLDLAESIEKGMTVDILCVSFSNIKCLHCIRYRYKTQDTSKYWYRLLPNSIIWPTNPIFNYDQLDHLIINGILLCKSRLPNTHILTTKLFRHFSKWSSNLHRNENFSGIVKRNKIQMVGHLQPRLWISLSLMSVWVQRRFVYLQRPMLLQPRHLRRGTKRHPYTPRAFRLNYFLEQIDIPRSVRILH